MAKSLPPLTWFRAFEAAARHLSFTLAGEELGLTQSAISQHVRALESRLENKLFVRANRSLHLTDAGRLLVPDVTAAIAQLDRATRRFLPVVSKPRLTVAASASIAHWVITPALAAFQHAHPDIVIQLATTIWPDDFSTTHADVEIRFGSAEIAGQDAKILRPSYLHAVAAPDLWAQLGPASTLSDLKRVPLIQPIGISQSWTEMGKKANPTVALEPSILVDTHGSAVDLAVAGAGIALAHAQISVPAVQQGLLKVLPLGQFPADEGYYLAAKQSPFPAERDAFVDWFKTLVSETISA